MVEFRRGFKTEAIEIAGEVRRELGLRPLDPLDPWRLAGHLAVPLLPLSELREAGGAAEHFLRVDQDAFSAVTVFHGSVRIITYNDSHSRPRQASDIAHELAHALLLHHAQHLFQREW